MTKHEIAPNFRPPNAEQRAATRALLEQARERRHQCSWRDDSPCICGEPRPTVDERAGGGSDA